ncbi:hypothetical protein SAMN05518672_11284 [Chitinophaga sp. CF118]|uniref:hypothetical protein n=1 Tax=Chitinophaga sp. CF118 TaxID=1884367 RepID=UPI0008EED4BC|nr:hypothetical protein [Chitinophaga sp. CF118]SFE92621.1 hypothetical protein SAMN05518672_11284 [Chitinophaga sp. CF118]
MVAKSKSQSAIIARNNSSDIVGAGGGTLLILLAQNLPENYSYKSWMVASAPAITMAVKFLWKLMDREYFFFKRKRNARKKRMEVTQDIDQLLNDPNTSNRVKETLREQREEVQLSLIKEQIRELNILMESR